MLEQKGENDMQPADKTPCSLSTNPNGTSLDTPSPFSTEKSTKGVNRILFIRYPRELSFFPAEAEWENMKYAVSAYMQNF